MTPEAYRDQLAQLQPAGKALPRDPNSTWMKLFAGLGVEFSRVHGRIEDLKREITLDGATELLPEWEEATGLPNKCAPAPADNAERLARIKAKLAEQGGQTPEYFIGIAARYGISITHDESATPFEIGVHGMGDPVGGYEWRYVWYIDVDPAPTEEFRTLLECVLGDLLPAHLVVKFRYGDEPTCASAPLYDGTYSFSGNTAYNVPACDTGAALYDGTYNYDGTADYGA